MRRITLITERIITLTTTIAKQQRQRPKQTITATTKTGQTLAITPKSTTTIYYDTKLQQWQPQIQQQ